MHNFKKIAVVAGLLGGSVLMGLGSAQAHEEVPTCDEQATDGHCGQKREYVYTSEDGKKVHVVIKREACAVKASTVDCSIHHP